MFPQLYLNTENKSVTHETQTQHEVWDSIYINLLYTNNEPDMWPKYKAQELTQKIDSLTFSM